MTPGPIGPPAVLAGGAGPSERPPRQGQGGGDESLHLVAVDGTNFAAGLAGGALDSGHRGIEVVPVRGRYGHEPGELDVSVPGNNGAFPG